jgi:hypothetical protein
MVWKVQLHGHADPSEKEAPTKNRSAKISRNAGDPPTLRQTIISPHPYSTRMHLRDIYDHGS